MTPDEENNHYKQKEINLILLLTYVVVTIYDVDNFLLLSIRQKRQVGQQAPARRITNTHLTTLIIDFHHCRFFVYCQIQKIKLVAFFVVVVVVVVVIIFVAYHTNELSNLILSTKSDSLLFGFWILLVTRGARLIFILYLLIRILLFANKS